MYEAVLTQGRVPIALRRFFFSAPLLIFAPSTFAGTNIPENPALADDFLSLEDGTKLTDWRVSNRKLQLTFGSGNPFGIRQMEEFNALVSETQRDLSHKVQWALMDLTNHILVDKSIDADRKVFGASASKPFVAASLLSFFHRNISASQKQLLANMLVVSSNSAWVSLQRQLGEGNDNLGRERVHNFTQNMGYRRTRGFQGYWGEMHGNELTATELVEFLYDTHQNNYEGAEIVWKLMHTCRTGAQRGLRYLPKDLPVGGKTGTYDGPTVDPETGRSQLPSGGAYKVQVRNHILTFWVYGTQYALAVLANNGQDDSAALLAGGFYRKLIGKNWTY